MRISELNYLFSRLSKYINQLIIIYVSKLIDLSGSKIKLMRRKFFSLFELIKF